MCCSALNTGTKIGSFFGATIFGIIAATTLGYSGAYMTFAVVSIIPMICMLTLKGLK